jgi:hypothetical protein
MKSKTFDYGDFVLEYRQTQHGPLYFLEKRITDVEEAIKEANKLKDSGYSDVMIKKNEKK